jgi:hypothetical protein
VRSKAHGCKTMTREANLPRQSAGDHTCQPASSDCPSSSCGWCMLPFAHLSLATRGAFPRARSEPARTCSMNSIQPQLKSSFRAGVFPDCIIALAASRSRSDRCRPCSFPGRRTQSKPGFGNQPLSVVTPTTTFRPGPRCAGVMTLHEPTPTDFDASRKHQGRSTHAGATGICQSGTHKNPNLTA